MANGDTAFLSSMIDAVETILFQFVATAQAGDPMAAMRLAVIALNELGGYNGRMGSFIDTMEREELCAFLEAVARTAGASWVGDDPTDCWREW